MTTVTIHDIPGGPEVTVTPAGPAPQVPTQPALPPLPVDFNRKPTSRDYPIGDPAHAAQGSSPAPYAFGSALAAGGPPMIETPTQAAVNAAQKHIRVRDANGRVIGIKKLGAGERMKMMRILGGTLSDNIAYFGHAMLAAAVRELDGEAKPMPTSAAQIEALVELLDDDGLTAIAEGIQKAGWIKAQDDKSLLDDAKN